MPKEKLTRKHYKYWIHDALRAIGGKGSLIDVNKQIWKHHEKEIRANGDSFFDWQYEVRWAATALRKDGMLKSEKQGRKGIWELA